MSSSGLNTNMLPQRCWLWRKFILMLCCGFPAFEWPNQARSLPDPSHRWIYRIPGRQNIVHNTRLQPRVLEKATVARRLRLDNLSCHRSLNTFHVMLTGFKKTRLERLNEPSESYCQLPVGNMGGCLRKMIWCSRQPWIASCDMFRKLLAYGTRHGWQWN